MVRFDEELGDIFAVLANREKCVQERDAAGFTSVFHCEFDAGMLGVHVVEEVLQFLPRMSPDSNRVVNVPGIHFWFQWCVFKG